MSKLLCASLAVANPFVVMGYLEHRWPPDYTPPQSTQDLAKQPRPVRIPYLRIPHLDGLCKPLSEMWNIDFHMEVELPSPA